MSLNTVARTWVVSELVTAAELNTEIRDAINGIQAVWDAWTPVLTASTTNPTLGSGSSANGTRIRIGKIVLGQFDISFGTSGVVAGSGIYEVTVPITAPAGGATAGTVAGGFVFVDASGPAASAGQLRFQSTTTVRMLYHGASTGLSAVAPVVPAASDKINGFLVYQAA